MRGLGQWKVSIDLRAIGGVYQVSVPLRGLGQWKEKTCSKIAQGTQVSVPLRGLGQWKAPDGKDDEARLASFSPLAGIRSVERVHSSHSFSSDDSVSVPLRGLGQWKDRRLKYLL